MKDHFGKDAKVAIIDKPRDLVRRKSDGALFEISHTGAFMPPGTLFLRRVKRYPPRFWRPREIWKRTGEVWEPESRDEFD